VVTTKEAWEEKLNQAIKDGDEFARRQAESELAALADQERMESRQQQQQAELQEIELPHDYNEAFGDPRANDTIRDLIRQVIERKNVEHNAELAEVIDSYKARLDVAETAVNELRDRLDDKNLAIEDLQEELKSKEASIEPIIIELKELNGVVSNLKVQLHEANEARADAEEKRDNAYNAMNEAKADLEVAKAENDRLRRSEESLKSQVNELEGLVRTYKQSKPTGGLQLTSALRPLTPEEEEQKRKQSKVEELNRILERRGIAPLPVPPLPSANAPEIDEPEVTDADIREQQERVSEAAEAAKVFPEVVSAESGAEEAAAGAEEACEDAGEADRAPTLAELAARIEALEVWKDSAEVRLIDLMG
jgi:chromosome segregation ATPase